MKKLMLLSLFVITHTLVALNSTVVDAIINHDADSFEALMQTIRTLSVEEQSKVQTLAAAGVLDVQQEISGAQVNSRHNLISRSVIVGLSIPAVMMAGRAAKTLSLGFFFWHPTPGLMVNVAFYAAAACYFADQALRMTKTIKRDTKTAQKLAEQLKQAIRIEALAYSL